MKVILHNSISLDGSISSMAVDIGLHYQVAAQFKPQALVVGSRTARSGIELFTGEIPPESAEDRRPCGDPKRRRRPLWTLVDSTGSLGGLLHVFRRFEMCREVVVLVSDKTPRGYLRYLKERRYPIIRTGSQKVDLARGLAQLEKKFGVKTALLDSGGQLGAVMLQRNLVHEISLILAPSLVGSPNLPLFRYLPHGVALKLRKVSRVGKDGVHLVYRVVPTAS